MSQSGTTRNDGGFGIRTNGGFGLHDDGGMVFRTSGGASLCCFAVLCLAHIAVIALAGLSFPAKNARTGRAQPSMQFAFAPSAAAETAASQQPVRPVRQAKTSAAEPAAVSAAHDAGGSSGGDAGTAAAGQGEADYLALIMRRLEEKKVYPMSMRKRGIEGDVSVYFVVKSDGSLAAVPEAENAAHPFLAQAALETVKSASPFPALEENVADFPVRLVMRFQISEFRRISDF
jgi:TonB family protein